MIDLAVMFFVEAFACCFQYTALQANSSLTFSILTHFSVDDFGLVTSFGLTLFFMFLTSFFLYSCNFLVSNLLIFADNDANRGSAP